MLKQTLNIVGIILTMTSLSSFAAKNIDSDKVSVKCFVDLYGGSQTITGAVVKSKQIGKLANKLVNNKIFVPGHSRKQQIYKVHECVLSSGEFKSALAKKVDEATPK
ncbi:hypothetical protein HII17_05135 [Thalassotalea sp. M1531]|uniref:Uncharacterized protein n=1 Tax=Thalassotalea algicola TaxID=2716224 RepID=A0A7Y0LB73_9GAMM|nr:TapY2 family type IVa secretion system protein [Thalassotalea algicola]NMP30942.1 hypothetical protein [Thalassotalea algicola]